ncbi:hypothetical protein EYZ11_007639 [Aspergillus tanneri]|uniref:Uncharacterized protein n=1 Tax=Aspergillus tanneri TaxID=1220188 RepID=A0A4S3JEQ9_9EURO|nr:hypothetical protein EYZ11_007639 [Aspergillus tanneri]
MPSSKLNGDARKDLENIGVTSIQAPGGSISSRRQ